MCGRCCEKIYVKHGKRVIDDEDFFNKLKTMHNFYDGLTCIGKDETGLICVFTKINADKKAIKIIEIVEIIKAKKIFFDFIKLFQSLPLQDGFLYQNVQCIERTI